MNKKYNLCSKSSLTYEQADPIQFTSTLWQLLITFRTIVTVHFKDDKTYQRVINHVHMNVIECLIDSCKGIQAYSR